LNESASTATARAIVHWMVAEVRGKGRLDQRTAVAEIRQRFGSEFLYTNKNGNLAIAAPVTAAFLKLTRKDVVWSFWGQYWRLREPEDPPAKRRFD
jgi:hypothetical protein